MVFVLVGVTVIVFLLVDFLLRREDRELKEVSQKRKAPIFFSPENALKPIKQVDKRLYHPSHSWLQLNGDGNAYVGFDDFIAKLFSNEVQVSDLPLIGAHVPQGANLWQVGTAKRHINQLSPLGGTVVEINPAFLANIPLQTSEVEKSWILKMRADNLESDANNLLENDMAGLMNSALADELVRFYQDPHYLNDGGRIDPKYLDDLSDDEWRKMTGKFFPHIRRSGQTVKEV